MPAAFQNPSNLNQTPNKTPKCSRIRSGLDTDSGSVGWNSHTAAPYHCRVNGGGCHSNRLESGAGTSLSRLTSQPHPLLIGVKTGNREGSPGVSCVGQVFLVVLCSALLCFKLFCMLKKGEIYFFFRVCVRAQ